MTPSASSDVDFDDYGEFGYQLEPEYTEEELRQMEETARDHLNLATTILVYEYCHCPQYSYKIIYEYWGKKMKKKERIML